MIKRLFDLMVDPREFKAIGTTKKIPLNEQILSSDKMIDLMQPPEHYLIKQDPNIQFQFFALNPLSLNLSRKLKEYSNEKQKYSKLP